MASRRGGVKEGSVDNQSAAQVQREPREDNTKRKFLRQRAGEKKRRKQCGGDKRKGGDQPLFKKG